MFNQSVDLFVFIERGADMPRLQQGPSEVRELTPAQKTAVARQAAKLLKDKKVARRRKGLILLSALLLVSPVDFLPEVLLGPLGLVDDAGYFATIIILGLRHRAAKVVSGGYAA